jgi:hypothetical protein
MRLGFIQSNWLRQYPFRAQHGIIDNDGIELPKDLIVGLRITCAVDDLSVFISHICTDNGFVSIAFAGSNGDIGSANGFITDSNQALPIKAYNDGVIGYVLVGNVFSTKPNQVYNFTDANGLVEPSTVTPITPPNVTSLNIKDVRYTGDITITSNSVTITSNGNTIGFVVKNPSAITSRGDHKAAYLTCSNNVISGINTVTPNTNGNIDIYTVAPLKVNIVTVNGIQQLQFSAPDLSLSLTSPEAGNLCKLLNLAPTNNSNTYADITTNPAAEWTSWEQYPPLT